MPPEPDSVTRRISPSSLRTSVSSRSRPRKRVSCSGRVVARSEPAQCGRRFRFVIRRRDDAIASALFREVGRFVGQLDDAHRIDAGLRLHRGHADADRNAPERRAVVIEVHRFDGGAHPFGDDDRVFQTRRRQDRGKLFAAVSREHVVGALDARAECVSDLLQARIARDVAVVIVERLEIVDVDEDDRHLRLGLDAPLPLADDPLVERAAIGDAGQTVARDEPLQRAVDAFLARVVHAHGEVERARFEQFDVGSVVGVRRRAFGPRARR